MTTLTANVTDFSQFAGLRRDARSPDADTLKQVTQQFESVFTHMLLKNMRQASLAPDPFAGPGSETYQDLMDQQWSLTLSQNGGMGLAKAMQQQLQPPAMNTLESHLSPNTETTSLPPRPPLAAASNAYQAVHGNGTGNTPESFMQSVWPAAEKAAAELGVSPKVLVAQAALETGWGRSTMKTATGEAGNNFFGIKSHGGWAGDQVRAVTHEFRDGVRQVESAAFRVYQSVEDSFNDFVAFLKDNPRYRGALAVADKPHQFVDALQKAGYATDPDYASKLKHIMDGRRMDQFVASRSDPQTKVA